jgi:predicted GNAT family acetyltransferase
VTRDRLDPAAAAVRHEPERHRFVLVVDGAESMLEYRPIGDRTLDYYRTFVPPELRRRGIASQLAEQALRYAAERGLAVAPTCPFVAAFIRSHPEFQPLVAAAR